MLAASFLALVLCRAPVWVASVWTPSGVVAELGESEERAEEDDEVKGRRSVDDLGTRIRIVIVQPRAERPLRRLTEPPPLAATRFIPPQRKTLLRWLN
jgi:hypothetical protein